MVMLKKLKISTSFKRKNSVRGDGVSEQDVHAFLDHAKYDRWPEVEKWLSADPARPAHVNDTPGGRWSALHQAARSGSDQACALLLRFGANPTATNRDGDTPADVAASRGLDERLLRNASKDWLSGRRRDTLYVLLRFDPERERAQYRDEAVLGALNEDPGAAQIRFPFVRYGRPMHPIFPSVRLGASADVVSALRDAHPPAMEETTQNGWTLLHEACRWDAPIDTLKFLVSKMPKALGSRNIFGQTPLHLACKSHASPDAVGLVAAAYPEAIDMKDIEERTPIMLAEEPGGSLEVAKVLHQAAKMSIVPKAFYTKLMEEDDRNINFKISELIPFIGDVHSARFFYTLVNSAFKSGGITSNDRTRYVAEGLRAASSTTTCTESIALFKLLLRKATDDGALTDLEKEKLDREAEVTHTSHAPFVQEMWEHIQSNTARIEGLECNLDALNSSIEKLKSGIRYQQRVEAAVGLMGVVLNAVSFGVAGSALSAATQATLSSIVDFGDVVHIGAVVHSMGDASVKDAFELGLQCAEAGAGAHLNRAVAEENPVVTIAFAARVGETGRAEVVAQPPNSNQELDDIVPVPVPVPKEKLTPHLIDRINFLEDQLSSGGVPASVSCRISNLEVQMFGSTQEERGSLLQRVEDLEDELGINQDE